jgi:hypothetical protein
MCRSFEPGLGFPGIGGYTDPLDSVGTSTLRGVEVDA